MHDRQGKLEIGYPVMRVSEWTRSAPLVSAQVSKERKIVQREKRSVVDAFLINANGKEERLLQSVKEGSMQRSGNEQQKEATHQGAIVSPSSVPSESAIRESVDNKKENKERVIMKEDKERVIMKEDKERVIMEDKENVSIMKEDKEKEKKEEKELRAKQQNTRGKRAIRRSKTRRKIITGITIAIIVLLVFLLVFNIISLKKEQYDTKKEQQALKQQKAELQKELENAETPENIEAQARQQLRLIKPGEVLYMFPSEITDRDDSSTGGQKGDSSQ